MLEKSQCLFCCTHLEELKCITNRPVDSSVDCGQESLNVTVLCQMILAIYSPLIDKIVFSEVLWTLHKKAFIQHQSKRKRQNKCIGNLLKMKNYTTWLEIWVTKTMVQVTSVYRFSDCAHFQVFKNKGVGSGSKIIYKQEFSSKIWIKTCK